MADKKQYYEDGKTPVPSYDHFSQLGKMVEQLQEQLNEINAIIDLYFPKDKKINAICVKPINDYRKKWCVK